ncbi:hypothetical protein KUTeg_015252 [Tegillarca granosa]|uniref:PH domain-containing protein n=1 Tax=Tegillarca granosa TaxID=220873 RepID=A0ABQ9EV38_TEGGR|nr:hypothetical protein KUTeg_015252 [Tegillarca granosa]
MEIAAQDLKNPIMEGFLEKRRPSYTFFERENRLTFDLKCAGRRSFEFVCSSNAELKQWRKAIKSASLYRCGPTGKKKKVPDVPVPETPPLYQEEDDEIFADPNEIKKHLERKYSKENNTVRGPDETEVKQQLERSQSTENILDRRPVPSPRTSHRHKGHHHRRHDDPNVNKGPQNLISNKQSFDDDDGYITVKKGPQKLTSSADDDSGYITVNKGPRTLIKHSDLVKEQSIQNSNSNAVSDNNDDNDNEALYLDLLGDNDLPNNNRSIEQNSTEELLQDPIYQNTNDPSLQYTTVLPKKCGKYNYKVHTLQQIQTVTSFPILKNTPPVPKKSHQIPSWMIMKMHKCLDCLKMYNETLFLKKTCNLKQKCFSKPFSK